MISVKITGGVQLSAALERLDLSKQRSAVAKLLVDGAEPIRARAAELAPTEPGAPDLSDHIVVSRARSVDDVSGIDSRSLEAGEAAVAVGPAQPYFYGLFQEFGTTSHRIGKGTHPGHGAKPFMRPAFDERQQAALRVIQDGIWTLLRKLTGGRTV